MFQLKQNEKNLTNLKLFIAYHRGLVMWLQRAFKKLVLLELRLVAHKMHLETTLLTVFISKMR